MPSPGGRRSRTTGRSPRSASARATARPRPDAPPLTITTRGSGRDTANLLDEPAARPAGQIGDDDGLATPAGEGGRLGKIDGGVVAALDEHVGPQPFQRRDRGVLVEDLDGVDAVERGEQLGPVDRR